MTDRQKLREEYEVEITKEGKYRVTTTRVSQRNVTDFVGEFDTYDEARDIMFNKFEQDFNRPSEFSIRHAGRSPKEKIWDYTPKGREVKASISIIEGTNKFETVEVRKATKTRPAVVQVRLETTAPTHITVRSLYPTFFDKRRQSQKGRLKRLRRFRSSRVK